MNTILNIVLTTLLAYVVMVILILIFSYIIPKKRKRLHLNKGAQFVIRKYKLKKDDKTIDRICLRLVFINALVITPPIVFFWYIRLPYMWVILICLAYFIPTLLGIYNLFGYILQKKGW